MRWIHGDYLPTLIIQTLRQWHKHRWTDVIHGKGQEKSLWSYRFDCFFLAEVVKGAGTDHEPQSLKVMIASLDRELRKLNKPYYITHKDKWLEIGWKMFDGKGAEQRRERSEKQTMGCERYCHWGREWALWEQVYWDAKIQKHFYFTHLASILSLVDTKSTMTSK